MSGVIIKENEVETLKQEYQEFVDKNLPATAEETGKPEEKEVPELCDY
jgi:hypothetical protein